jgi:porin
LEPVKYATKATLQSDFGSIACRIASFTCLSTMLALGWPVRALAQQAADANETPAPTPTPSAQKQAPSPAANAPGTPAPASPKTRKLNCHRAANPGKRRFGCKDEDFDWEETLTSNWNGVREEAKRLGLTPSASYYSALQTNASGGPHQIWGYTGQFTAALDVNFEKLFKLPGVSLYLSGSWGTGSNMTGTLDSVFPVNPNFAVGAYIGELYLQQKLLHGDLILAVGHLAASFAFANLPVFENYVSFAMNPTPVSLVSNDLSYTGPPPGLEWGVQALYNITPVVQVAGGVFNTNPYSATNGNVFALQQGNKGVLVTAQASYLRSQGPKDEGKPGQYTAGFFADNNSFATLPDGTSQSDGNAGVFVLGQQMVYRPGGPGTSEGLTIWGAWAYSSKQLVSSMPVFGGAGLSYEGLIKKRKQDSVNVGWIYGKTSKYIPGASAAKLFEANYQWVAKRYLTLVPDFQYIWDTNGTNGSGAAVLGLQATLTF